ncbi:MAG: O-antigen ligase family protein [Leptolyngbyaceae cyanobacterium T60_A2020_046]|nr:O-antigen ligase family protein [Leptolyngbyaceae cyanobacterium T60_A2020_046]
MHITWKLIRRVEHLFVQFAICFFVGVWSFESLFIASEGATNVFFSSRFLDPILSLTQHSIFLTCIFTFVVLNWKTFLGSLIHRKLLWALSIFICISFLWSDFPHETLMKSVSLFETIFFGIYFGACFPLQRQLRILQIAFVLVATLSLAVSIILPSAGRETGVHAAAWRGVFAHKNYLARNMSLGALLGRMTSSQNPMEKRLSIFLMGSAIFLVIMSTSKTGLLILLIVLALAEIFRSLRLELGLVILTWTSAIFMLSGLASFIAANFEAIVTALDRDPTLSGRTIIWGALIDKIHLRPWLGYGYYGFWRGAYGESAIISKIITAYIPPHAHNGLFDLVIAFGLIGLALFSLNFLFLIRRSVILARNTQIQEGLWPLCYSVLLVLYNQTESTLVEHNSIFWLLFIALLAADFRTLAFYERALEENHLNNN